MFVDEVVELVLPPFPPLEKLSASTAVPGTRSKGSLAAPPALTAARATRRPSARTLARLPTLLNMNSPLLGEATTSTLNDRNSCFQNLFLISLRTCSFLVRLTRQSTELIDQSVEIAGFRIHSETVERLRPVAGSEGDDAEIPVAGRPARGLARRHGSRRGRR